jgi:radical SAM superfamily enzyme YgiQ (UPF0313 family)
VLLDAKADLLVYGNGERQIVEIAHRLAGGARIEDITDLRGTAFVRNKHDFIEIRLFARIAMQGVQIAFGIQAR